MKKISIYNQEPDVVKINQYKNRPVFSEEHQAIMELLQDEKELDNPAEKELEEEYEHYYGE